MRGKTGWNDVRRAIRKKKSGVMCIFGEREGKEGTPLIRLKNSKL